MSENEKGYYIREFSNMTGLPQSKIRYYEKIGLFKVKRMKNGYRWFSPGGCIPGERFPLPAAVWLQHRGSGADAGRKAVDRTV